jgi:hypothetical protein
MPMAKINAAALVGLALLGASARAVEPVRLTNTSGVPLCLRVEGASAPVCVQGEGEAGPTELGPGRPGAGYCLQPGATCTLQVEGAQEDGGRLVLQWQPASLHPKACPCPDGAPPRPSPAPAGEDPWEERRAAGWGGDWY